MPAKNNQFALFHFFCIYLLFSKITNYLLFDVLHSGCAILFLTLVQRFFESSKKLTTDNIFIF